MSDILISSWAWMLLALLFSVVAGMGLVRLMPWGDSALRAGIPLAFSFGIAPFLLGIMAVFALGVFRGDSHVFHIGVVFSGLLLLCTIFISSRKSAKLIPSKNHSKITAWDRVFGGLLAIWAIALIVNAVSLPLIQNDSLEYATVGKILFELRDLLSYPAIDPNATMSGFYGPWTHPPLYVAIIYLTYVFQSQADFPGLMRLISPWCALSATALVYTLGNLKGRLTGILSALLFLSVPLFFLGADSALIDSFSVLGFTLVFVAVIGLKFDSKIRSVAIGLTLGLALWTHSQAILFLPLTFVAEVFYRGWKDRRTLLIDLVVIFSVAVALGIWPYARNVTIYGSIISDTPSVFAMPELAWDEYFKIARGIDSWSERLQYGILKGWFVFEAYSFIFWSMTLGIIVFIVRFLRQSKLSKLIRGDTFPIFEKMMIAAFGVVLFYLGGVVVSTIMGIDLMIRNERYWLVLLPFAALFSTEGLVSYKGIGDNVCKGNQQQQWPPLLRYVIPAIAILISFQTMATIGYRWIYYEEPHYNLKIEATDASLLQDFFKDKKVDFSLDKYRSSVMRDRNSGKIVKILEEKKEEKLNMWPQILAMQFLRDCLKPESVVLSLRPADMYYSNRRMISYLDPRLISFYHEKDIFTACSLLRNLGVTHIYIPDYYLPPIYNSMLQQIISHPELTRLIFSADGNQIYELYRRNNVLEETTLIFTPGNMPWTIVKSFTGGRKALGKFNKSSSRVIMRNIDSSNDSFPFFQRDLSSAWISGVGKWNQTVFLKSNIPVSGSTEYRVEIDLEGRAFLRIWLLQIDTDGNALKNFVASSSNVMRFGEIVLGPTYPERLFQRRFKTHSEAAFIRIGVEHLGNSNVDIQSAKLIRIFDKNDNNSQN